MKNILLIIAVLFCISANAQKILKDTIYFNNGVVLPCKIIFTSAEKIQYSLLTDFVITNNMDEISYYIQSKNIPKSSMLTSDNSPNYKYCGDYLKRASRRMLTGIAINFGAVAVTLIGLNVATDYQSVYIVSGAISVAGIGLFIAGITDLKNAGWILNPTSNLMVSTTGNGLTLAWKF